MGRTITAYCGKASAVLGNWGPSGTYRGRSMGIPFLTNATASNNLTADLTSSTASYCYPIRYKSTTSNWTNYIVTMAANEIPQKLAFSTDGKLYVVNDDYVSNTATRTFNLYIAGERVTSTPYLDQRAYITTKTNSSEGSETSVGTLTVPTDLRAFYKGKELWFFILLDNTNEDRACRWRNRSTVTITTHYICTAPTTITVPSTASSKITLSWSGATAQDGTISGYLIQYRDKAPSSNTWGDWESLPMVSSTETSGSLSVIPNPVHNGMRQFRIKTVASERSYDSDWSSASSAVTTSQPLVEVGDLIYETAHTVEGRTVPGMDELRLWKEIFGINANDVTTGDKATIVDGHTYNPTITLTQNTTLNASWYNTADSLEETMTITNTTVTIHGVTAHLSKWGRICQIYYSGSITSAWANGADNGYTLPSEYAPLQTVIVADCGSSGIGSRTFALNTNGVLYHGNAGSAASGANMRFSMTYITAS